MASMAREDTLPEPQVYEDVQRHMTFSETKTALTTRRLDRSIPRGMHQPLRLATVK